ncbi:MAG: ABC transporter permease subunit [Coriobacteriia bacterium]
MNIFLRELKAHRWGLLFWSIGIVFIVSAGMAKYAAFETAGQSVTQMLSQIPQGVQAVFGMTGFDLSTASGFYGMLYLYVVVMGTIHAALLGAHLISKEERDRTSEFLYTKPVSRSQAVTSKLLAGLVNIIALNLVTLVSSLYFVDYFSKEQSITNDVLLLMAGMFFLQLIFFSIGVAVAGILRKPKAAASMASMVMFVAFLVSYLVNMNVKLEFLKYVTPFKYFDAAAIMSNGGLDLGFIALSVAIIALAIAGTYRFYSARDLSV